MKTRRGFVSNSSSSSFVVAFDRENPDADYIRNQFGAINYYSEYIRGNEMNILIKDTLDQTPVLICEQNRYLLTKKFFENESLYYELYYHGSDPIAHEMKKREDELCNKLWHSDISDENREYIRGELNIVRDEMRAYDKAKLDQRICAWIKKNEGLYAFHYDYADEDGNAVLEHGSHWQNVNVWVFSHH